MYTHVTSGKKYIWQIGTLEGANLICSVSLRNKKISNLPSKER